MVVAAECGVSRGNSTEPNILANSILGTTYH
jgi:hypothetical protein